MILPTKHISPENSLLGVSALVLKNLNKPRTITSLWEDVRKLTQVGTYQRFILSLDLLYLMEVIELEEGLLRRVKR